MDSTLLLGNELILGSDDPMTEEEQLLFNASFSEPYMKERKQKLISSHFGNLDLSNEYTFPWLALNAENNSFVLRVREQTSYTKTDSPK